MGRVYAVVSAKGGVGKTTTTTNLAAALAASGADVAVVDGDLGMANLAGSLSVDSGGATLHDVLAGEADLADAMRTGPHGMTVIPGSPDLDAFARADPEGLRDVLDALRTQHDYVLLDTGAGLSNDTVVPLTYVDEALLVSTTGRDALGDTEKTRQVAERLGIHVAGAVITRVDPDSPQNAAVGETLQATVLSSIPRSDVVRDAGDAGEPLTTYAPGSSAAAAYRALAADLTGESVRTRGADETDETRDAAPADDAAPTDGDDAPADSVEEEPLVAVDVSGDTTPSHDDGDDDTAADDDPLIETAAPEEMGDESDSGDSDADGAAEDDDDSTGTDGVEASESNGAVDDVPDAQGDADAEAADDADTDAEATDIEIDEAADDDGAESEGGEADGEEGVYTTSLADEDDEQKEKKGLFGRFLG